MHRRTLLRGLQVSLAFPIAAATASATGVIALPVAPQMVLAVFAIAVAGSVAAGFRLHRVEEPDPWPKVAADLVKYPLAVLTLGLSHLPQAVRKTH